MDSLSDLPVPCDKCKNPATVQFKFDELTWFACIEHEKLVEAEATATLSGTYPEAMLKPIAISRESEEPPRDVGGIGKEGESSTGG